jgi:hypothetical protein
MNIVTKGILGLAIALSAIATFGKSSYAEPKFFCDQEQMSTVVHSHWGELPMIRWTDTSFPPPYTPVERCQQVTARFNRFNDDGTLKYMRSAMMGNSPVICVAGVKGGKCLPDGLLITLKYGSDPNIALKRILDRRMWATAESIQLSDKEDGLIFEVDDTVYVDVETLLNGKEVSKN